MQNNLVTTRLFFCIKIFAFLLNVLTNSSDIHMEIKKGEWIVDNLFALILIIGGVAVIIISIVLAILFEKKDKKSEETGKETKEEEKETPPEPAN